MNPELAVAIRVLMVLGGGFMVDRQWLDQAELEMAVAAILVVGAAIWGFWSKRPNSKEAVKVAERVAESDNSPAIVKLASNETVTEIDPQGRRETDHVRFDPRV